MIKSIKDLKFKLCLIYVISVIIFTVTFIPFLNLPHTYQESKVVFSILFLVLMPILIKNDRLQFKCLILILPIIVEILFILIHKDTLNYNGIIDLIIYTSAFIYAIIFTLYNASVENKIKFLCQLMFIIGLLLIVSSISQNLIDTPKNLFSGNQNISAFHIFMSVVAANYLFSNKKLKIIYSIVALLSLGLLIKARIPFIILIIYLLYYFYSSIKVNKYKLPVLLFILSTVILVILFNKRFHDFLNHDIYIRIYSWLRILKSIGLHEFILGFGPGNLYKIFNDNQNLYPAVEILIEKTTYYYAHNFLLDKIVVGGIINLIVWLLIFSYVIYRCFIYRHNPNFKPLIVCVSYAIFTSFYDVSFNYFSSLLIAVLLMSVIIVGDGKNNTFLIKPIYYYLISYVIYFALLIVLVITLATNYVYNPQKSYQDIILGINTKKDISTSIIDLNDKSPNYGELPTITAFDYLFNTPKADFKREKLISHLDHAAEYNKYYKNRLHIASQYYSFSSDRDKLMIVYGDIFYKLLVANKVINIAKPRENYTVIAVREPNFLIDISHDFLTMKINQNLLDELIVINSSIHNLEVPQDVIQKIIEPALHTDSKNNLTKKVILTRFLNEINEFGKPLLFNK